jgi:NADP-dependent aldehyde dehydrogenase
MTITGKNLIAGQWSGDAHNGFVAFNTIENTPMTAQFADATKAEVDSAIIAAQSAFLTYSQLPAARRAAFLRTIGEQILELGDELVEDACA